MQPYRKEFEIRWSDLDPNYHVLHSKYYDFGAFCRMSLFVEKGLTPSLLQQLDIGPILFREECLFKREILFGDKTHITLHLTRHTDNYSRWSFSHEIFKNDILAAVINVDGAWIDTKKRKLASPPQAIIDIFQGFNR